MSARTSSGMLPRFLDLRKLTAHGGKVSGVMEIGQLPRLAEFAGDGKEQVEASLSFYRDDEGRQRIQGDVRVRLHLACQRCLKPMVSDVHAPVRLVVVWSEDAIRHLPAEMDPWLAGEEPAELATLLEEEILLALPLVALHEECLAPTATATTTATTAKVEEAVPGAGRERVKKDEKQAAAKSRVKENPFSVLAGLKKQQD